MSITDDVIRTDPTSEVTYVGQSTYEFENIRWKTVSGAYGYVRTIWRGLYLDASIRVTYSWMGDNPYKEFILSDYQRAIGPPVRLGRVGLIPRAGFGYMF